MGNPCSKDGLCDSGFTRGLQGNLVRAKMGPVSYNAANQNQRPSCTKTLLKMNVKMSDAVCTTNVAKTLHPRMKADKTSDDVVRMASRFLQKTHDASAGRGRRNALWKERRDALRNGGITNVDSAKKDSAKKDMEEFDRFVREGSSEKAMRGWLEEHSDIAKALAEQMVKDATVSFLEKSRPCDRTDPFKKNGLKVRTFQKSTGRELQNQEGFNSPEAIAEWLPKVDPQKLKNLGEHQMAREDAVIRLLEESQDFLQEAQAALKKDSIWDKNSNSYIKELADYKNANVLRLDFLRWEWLAKHGDVLNVLAAHQMNVEDAIYVFRQSTDDFRMILKKKVGLGTEWPKAIDQDKQLRQWFLAEKNERALKVFAKAWAPRN